MRIVQHKDKGNGKLLPLWSIGDGSIRVEAGIKRKRAKATKELLADAVTHPKYRVGAFDAAGKVIKEGAEMEYLDHYDKEREFNVYRLQKDDKGVERFLKESSHEDVNAALSAATDLAEIHQKKKGGKD